MAGLWILPELLRIPWSHIKTFGDSDNATHSASLLRKVSYFASSFGNGPKPILDRKQRFFAMFFLFLVPLLNLHVSELPVLLFMMASGQLHTNWWCWDILPPLLQNVDIWSNGIRHLEPAYLKSMQQMVSYAFFLWASTHHTSGRKWWIRCFIFRSAKIVWSIAYQMQFAAFCQTQLIEKGPYFFLWAIHIFSFPCRIFSLKSSVALPISLAGSFIASQ